MRGNKKSFLCIVGMILLLPLIFDAEVSLEGARKGLELCIYTVIPSLFPFFCITALISNNFYGIKLRWIHTIEKICKIPEGSGLILILSFISGYPIGAKTVNDACKNGGIDKASGERMVCFCNQAGPAFILGITGTLFSDVKIALILWAVIIVSALLTAILIPETEKSICHYQIKPTDNIIQSSIKSMASVCSWVILFRILITFLDRWILWAIPPKAGVLINGFLELTNGCIALHAIEDYRFRFIAAAAFLSLGGLCVTMQTFSVTKTIQTKQYFYGKLIQCVIAVLLAAAISVFLFPGNIL